MALAGGGEGAIEGYFEAGGVGVALSEKTGSAVGAHRVGRGGSFPYFIQFTKRIHKYAVGDTKLRIFFRIFAVSNPEAFA
jgi:hypothetical protein